MDYLKTRAPFWKQVEYATARRQRDDWVDAKQPTTQLAERWSKPPGRREAAE